MRHPAGRRETARRLPVVAAALAWLVVASVVAPRIVNPYIFQILIYIGINIILAASLNMILGLTGQFSIGHAGFMAVGAYAAASMSVYFGPWLEGWLTSVLHLPAEAASTARYLAALLFGGALAALAGLAVGIPTLRLRGDYLAIATLGFGEIIRVLILNLDFVGGARGFVNIPEFRSLFWVYFWVVVTLTVIHNMVVSSRGMGFLAVREDEIAAGAIGIPTTRYKVTAFVVSSFFAGVAGGLLAHYMAYLHTNSFTFIRSFEIIVMVVLGGMGSLTGSVLAATILTVLPEALRPLQNFRMVIYSALLIVLMLARPQGLLGTRELTLARLQAMLFARRKGKAT